MRVTEIFISTFKLFQFRPLNAFGFPRVLIVISLFFIPGFIQESFSQQADSLILFPNGRTEVYFRFFKPADASLTDISKIVSIDRRRGDTLYAYANLRQFNSFQRLNIKAEILIAPSMVFKSKMTDSSKGFHAWDAYPTYTAYIQMMQNYATAYPSLCRLDTLGSSANGHLLLVMEISNHPGVIEAKPEFMYSSTMHGDEVTGYVLTLRLIDYLLSNYGSDSLVTRLVNRLHIWINPLANPDGTYAGGDSTVNGATRYLRGGIDPNRNFPDPQYGQHPDGQIWAKETIAMMNFMEKHRFVMSANFHGGDEVVNYPWDTWGLFKWDASNIIHPNHPDSAWFASISKEYADSSQHYGPAGYFKSVASAGYIDGYYWYQVAGGRQDYMTYFMHGREVTIELDIYKTPPASYLPAYWNANYRSFLHYMEESTFGLHGIVTDSMSGKPVYARIEAVSHDADHSEVYSDSITGYYSRLIGQGIYAFQVSAPGYYSKLLNGVSVKNHQTTTLNIKLLFVNKYPPVLKNDSGRIVDTLVIEMNMDSAKRTCLHISDPQKQLAWIDTIFTLNSNVKASFSAHDSCLVLTPDSAFKGSDAMNLVLCDNGNPALCDTFTIIAHVNRANLVKSIIPLTSVIAYPNPFGNELIIQIDKADQFEKNIIIYDITGKECLNEKFKGNGKIISTESLSKGIYLLRLSSNSKFIISQKLIKAE